MMYTIQSAQWANADQTAAVIMTVEAGAVLIAPVDTEAWGDLLQSGIAVAAYAEPLQPIPNAISDRQFFQQLAVEGLITQPEALDAVRTGAIPAPLQTFVDAITDPAERFAAEMLLSGAVEFRRDHPLSLAIGVATGKTPAEIDQIWRAAALL